MVAGDGAHVDLLIEGLPSAVNADFDPSDGHAHVHASSAVTKMTAELTSDAGIFGQPYKWFFGEITSIPADWDVDVATGTLSVVATDAAANPAPLGLVKAILSRETKAASADNLDAFTTINGGMVVRSGFLDVIDDRYFPGGVETRLDTIYNTNVRLDGTPMEDHVIVRQPSDLEYVDVQFGGFQSLSVTTSGNDLNASVNIPTAGTHPLFVGYEGGGGQFWLVQVEDIPDTTTVDVVEGDHAHFDASGSMGQVDVYNGPLPMAQEGDTALRVTMLDTPSSVHLDYANLDAFPGGASFTASNAFEVLLLTQDSSSRVVAGLQMKDLFLNYGFEGPGFECDPVAGVDTCFGLFKVSGGISVGAGPGASGFFMQYDLDGSPDALVGSDAVPAAGAEYVPRFSALLGNFQIFEASLEVQLDPLQPLGELFPIDIEFNLTGPIADNFVFDFWDLGFSACFADTCITNDPDYINNNPWHVVPLFHDFGSHFEPF